MAATITNCTRLLTDEASINEEGVGTERATFLVEVSQANATPLEVRKATHANMPVYGSVHPIDIFLKVISKTAKRAMGSNGKPAMHTWQVEVIWGVPKKGVTGNTTNSNNVKVSVSGVKQTIYTQDDKAGNQILNAAKDMYPDPQEDTLYDEQISIDFETDTIDMDAISEARGKINDAAVSFNIPQGDKTFNRTFATHTLLLDTIDYSVEVSEDGEAHMFRVRVVILHRFDTWLKRLPQKGYRYKVTEGAVTKLTEWKDTPQYLNATGFKLPDNEAIVLTDPIQLKHEADLTTLLQGI